METVASKCLCETISVSFRSATPKLNATILNNPMGTVASKCLCETISVSFRGATPKLNAAILNNPSKAQLSQKVWQLWDIQWKQWPQSAYARQYVQASEVLPGCHPQAERNNFEQSKKVHVITEAMAAMRHTMEKVASIDSKCLCEKKSRSFRSATPKLNAAILNNPSKGQLSQKVWQL